MRFERGDGTSVVLYYATPEEGQGESTIHQYLVSYVLRLLKGMGVPVVHVANPSEPLADVETESTFYEVETGLKKRTDDLQERIARFGEANPFVIVVPNDDVKEAYRRLASDRVTVKTLYELPHH